MTSEEVKQEAKQECAEKSKMFLTPQRTAVPCHELATFTLLQNFTTTAMNGFGKVQIVPKEGVVLPIFIEMKCEAFVPETTGLTPHPFPNQEADDPKILQQIAVNMEPDGDHDTTNEDLTRLCHEIQQIVDTNSEQWRMLLAMKNPCEITPETPFHVYPMLNTSPGFPPRFKLTTTEGDFTTGIFKAFDEAKEKTDPNYRLTDLKKILGNKVKKIKWELGSLKCKYNPKNKYIGVSVDVRARTFWIDSVDKSTRSQFVPPEMHPEGKMLAFPASEFQLERDGILLPMSKPADNSSSSSSSSSSSGQPQAKKQKTLNTGKDVKQEKKAPEKKEFRPRMSKCIMVADQTPVFLHFSGGGMFNPTWGYSFNENYNSWGCLFSMTDPKEIATCDHMHNYFLERVIKERANYFPQAALKSLDVIKEYVKPFLKEQRRKLPKDITDEEKAALLATPIVEGDEVWPRSMKAALSDPCYIYESNGKQLNKNEYVTLNGRQWVEMVIAIGGTYLQVDKAAWSIRLVYVKLHSGSEQYEPAEEDDL